jgi:FkbM family methyltransferase
MISEIRNIVSPWWNRHLARKRLERVLAYIRRSAPDFAPVAYDVGARWGISEPFDRLLSIPSLKSVGFEPDPEEAAKLEAGSAFTRVCPVALGLNEETRTLFLAKDPGCSSLFPPNHAEIALHTSSPRFETTGRIEVATVPMDLAISRFNLPAPTFLKIDCEGAEGEIIQGAKAAMEGVIGLTFEARFRDFYEGGSILGDLMETLFGLGYICVKQNPVGDFSGALMMFDVSMVRHPDRLRSADDLLAAVLFCLIHDNWLYASRLAERRAGDFDLQELRDLLRR